MPASDPQCGLLHCQHPLDPSQPDVQFVSPSASHYELMEIVRQLEGIRFVLETMFNASQQLQAQAQTYLENQKTHAESFLGRLDTPDYYPFVSLPVGTAVMDPPDGGKQFVMPGGAIVLVRPDGTMTAVCDGKAVDLAPGGSVVLPDGQTFQVQQDYHAVPHAAAGMEGLPHDVQPICIGRGRYRVAFPDGVVLTAWHAMPAEGQHPAQACMLHIANPTGGVLVISRKGIQGIGIEVQVRLLADGALGFRVLPDGSSGAVQYLHAGTARPLQGVVEVALSNGATITYRCGRAENDEDDHGHGDDAEGLSPSTFQCEERDQCGI